jgi:copper chaperone
MTILSVPDMSCGHCKASVTQALGSVADAGSIQIDMDKREVALDGSAAPETLIAALNQVGFPATVLSAK